ncbi:hypothetical protein [Enterococcus avium]|uniref:hypothetical protein n=1 Tax=Enterococcus avium TaxID=33945 RepID=UPI001F5A066C|nr:hypothetical protein [Enterococcus avium]
MPICGIPEHFYTDHGSDFTSDHLEQVAIDLKINLLFSKVGVPRGRGKIERFFLTVNQLFLESLPGYIGNSDKTERLNFQEFRNKLHHFLIYNYNLKEHSSIKRCPTDKWNSKSFLPRFQNYSIEIDDLIAARNKRKKILNEKIHSPSSVDLLITEQEEKAIHSNKMKKPTLKRYFNE